jgi:hypothetical protein
MTWLPISGTLPQFTTDGEQANGYVLKFYAVGTTTPLTVAAAITGTPTTTSFVLDTEGYTTLSAVRVIPHVQSAYKLIMYLNQADADANNTGSAVWTVDNILLASTTGSVTTADNVTQLANVNNTFFQTAIVKGTTTINDGGQGIFYYDSTSIAAPNGTTIIAPTAGTGNWLILPVNTLWLATNAVTTAKILDANVTPAKLSFAPLVSVTEYIYTAGATHTPSAAAIAIEIQAIGAGGGGGGIDSDVSAGTASTGGAGGGYVYKRQTTLDASYTIVVGSGGSGGAAGFNNGAAGGNTTVTSDTLTIVASGGTGGQGADSTVNVLRGVRGGDASGGDINTRGSGSTSSWTGLFLITTSTSGCSIFGGSESSRGSPNDGYNAAAFGAGGGACSAEDVNQNLAGGDGADGVVIIREYIKVV